MSSELLITLFCSAQPHDPSPRGSAHSALSLIASTFAPRSPSARMPEVPPREPSASNWGQREQDEHSASTNGFMVGNGNLVNDRRWGALDRVAFGIHKFAGGSLGLSSSDRPLASRVKAGTMPR